MPLVDLHNHTTASDGIYSPSELIRKAAELKIDYFAISDHDTINGLNEAISASKSYPDLHFVPGIEITSTIKPIYPNFSPKSECHILGLNIDSSSIFLGEFITKLHERRMNRAPLIIQRVNEVFGLLASPITELEVREINHKSASDALGRPHIARTIVARGLCKDLQEVFDKYLFTNGPCFVRVPCPHPKECIEAIVAAKGVAILAHPISLVTEKLDRKTYKKSELFEIIKKLKNLGISGIEVKHPSFSKEEEIVMNLIAEELDLIKSSGTDFHSEERNEFGSFSNEIESVEWLNKNR